MRFAWLRDNSTHDVSVKPGFTNQLIFLTYNIVFWIPVVLSLVKAIDYGTGLLAFTVIIVLRAIANLYRNNVLKPEQAQNFPFRAP